MVASFAARGSELIAVCGAVDPDAYTQSATSNKTDSCDMALFESAVLIVLVGIAEATSTIDIDITSGSDDSTFGNTVDSATQLVATDDDKQVVMNVRGEDLTTGDRYVRGEITVGTAAFDMGAVLLGINPVYGPANANDLSTVDEITTP